MRFNVIIRCLKTFSQILLRVRQSVTVTHPIILADSEAVSLNGIPALLPFLAKPCASSVRLFCQGSSLRFDKRETRAPLTARTDSRLSPPRRAFASFFQAEITLERRKKERNEPMPDRQHASWCGFRKLWPHSFRKFWPV